MLRVAVILSAVMAYAASIADLSPKPVEPNFGKAVIIVSHGRSGSTWFCDLIQHTSADNKAKLSYEVLGSNSEEAKRVKFPTQVAVDFLNKQRENYPSGFVGFKIKPYDVNEGIDDFYRFLVVQKVPVLLLYRNTLDFLTSVDKHQEAPKTPAHCTKGNDKCIEMHQSVTVAVDSESLLKSLDYYSKFDNALVEKFKSLKMNYLHVSYDELAFGCPEKKRQILQKILNHIYPDKSVKANMKMLESKFESTSDRNQSNVISNYAEVVKALTGTPYAGLLRTADPPCRMKFRG